MKIKLIELERDRIKATFRARDFSTLNLATKQQHLVTDRKSKHKVSKNVEDLNNTIKIDLIDLHKIQHPTPPEHTFLSTEHGMLTKINRVLGHNTGLSTIKMI